MAVLTPHDIQSKRFRTENRGYSPEEVDSFLTALIADYEQLTRENLESKDRIVMLVEAIKQYKAIEESLQSALVVAQSTGDEMLAKAKTEAEELLSEAKSSAEKIMEDARRKEREAEYKMEDVKRGVKVYAAKVKALLKTESELLEQIENSDGKE